MYAEGHGSIDIMNHLNKKGILNPSSYHQTKYKKKPSNKWNQITILSMLRNQVYIGNTVQNKKRKISYKCKKVVDNPVEQWIIVENTHEAIIDDETFRKVELMLKSKDTSKYTKHEYLFKGLLKCYHCGRNLQMAQKGRSMYPYINCIGHVKRGKHPISMNYWKFEENILEVIRNICKMYLDETIFVEAYKNYKNNYISLQDEYQKKLVEIESKVQNINSNVDKMYMDKLNGIVSADDYMSFITYLQKRKRI